MINDDMAVPDAPEAPPHWDSSEATAWESGWEAGYAAALSKEALGEVKQ